MSTNRPHWISPGDSHQFEQHLTHPGVVVYRAASPRQPVITVGGLYGVLLVRGRDEPVVDQERILVVHRAELTAANPKQAQYRALGNGRSDPPLLLLNGVRHSCITMPAGSRERWRILNLATDVQLRVCLPRPPARGTGRGERRAECSEFLGSPAATLPTGLDLPMGPFAPNQQITLDAVIGEDGQVGQHRQLLTCHII